MSGIYLSVSVAMGDLCADPAEYLVSQSPSGLPADVLLYYTQCETARANPFTQRLRESQTAISNARNSMNIISRISVNLFKQKPGLTPKLSSVISDLNTSERLLTGKFNLDCRLRNLHCEFCKFFVLGLTALVDCKLIHYNYLVGTRGLCENGLLGLVLMLIASFLAACLLTIMVISLISLF
jgi:protein tweety